MMVACGVSLAAAALPPAQAQEAPAGPGSERSLADPDAAAFDEALGQWQAEITANEEQVTDSSTSDEDLRQIPQKLEELRENILQQRARLTPRLEDRRERLAKLGPVPADGAPKESDAIAAKRQDLESQIAALDDSGGALADGLEPAQGGVERQHVLQGHTARARFDGPGTSQRHGPLPAAALGGSTLLGGVNEHLSHQTRREREEV